MSNMLGNPLSPAEMVRTLVFCSIWIFPSLAKSGIPVRLVLFISGI